MSSVSSAPASAPAPPVTPAPRVPPARFAVAFGLTGLAGAWDAASRYLGAGPVVGAAIGILATAVLVGLLVAYIAERIRVPGAFAADFGSPVGFPFLALPIVSAELLISRVAGAAPVAAACGFVVLVTVGLAFAVIHLGRLISGGVRAEHLHGGQLLPSVAGTIVPALVLARAGFGGAATALLGTGLVLALVFGVLLAASAIGGTPVVAALRPTLAILIAPPALGGAVALELGAEPRIIAGFVGGTVLAIAMQLVLLPAIRRSGFSPALWSFSFPTAAAVAFFLAAGGAAGAATPSLAAAGQVSGWVGVALLTAVVAALGAMTVVRGRG